MKSLLWQLKQIPFPTIVAVIVICVSVFLVEEAGSLALGEGYGAVPAQISAVIRQIRTGQFGATQLQAISCLVTPLFLHGGPDHLLGNMVFFWAFGTLVARLLGNWWGLSCFLLTGVCGNLLQVGMKPDSMIPIIGASGGVAGLEGIYLGLALRWHLPWPDVFPLAHPIPPLQLAAFAAMGIAFDIYSVASQSEAGVAYGAHLGGFASGLLIAVLITTFYRNPERWSRTGKHL